MKSFLSYIFESTRTVKPRFLKTVKHSTTDGPTHRYNFDHMGKPVEIDIDTMSSGRQEVDFSYGGRMTRMGAPKMRGAELYKKIGKVIRAHDRLGRGTKHGYEFGTIHEPSINPKVGWRSDTRPRVTGKLLKKLSSKMNKKYSEVEGEPTAWDQRRTIHTVSEQRKRVKRGVTARKGNSYVDIGHFKFDDIKPSKGFKSPHYSLYVHQHGEKKVHTQPLTDKIENHATWKQAGEVEGSGKPYVQGRIDNIKKQISMVAMPVSSTTNPRVVDRLKDRIHSHAAEHHPNYKVMDYS